MNAPFLIVQLVNIAILFLWPVLALIALFGLRRCQMSEGARVAWAFLILAIPIFGALAFWIVSPGTEERSAG